MTSFTQEQSGDLGLNIVYEEATNKAPLKGKKPKKRNKYERRREKSKRATDKKQEAVTSAEERGPMNSTSEEVTEESLTVESNEITIEQHPFVSEETTIMVPDPNNPPTDVLPNTFVEEPAATSNSRKTHKTTTLEDDEERAKYMAEFHARPLEIDRRSGASSRIAPSKASTHLFQDESGCAQLGLHARLTTCLTSRFQLERPTVIQQKSLLALENKSDANLFVQSETGSGKTLAFLLPIIQVRTLFTVSEKIVISMKGTILWLRHESIT